MNNNNFVIFFTQQHFKTGNNILYMFQIIELKTLDTFSYCQRLFFSVGVSQHYALDNKPVKKLNSIGRRSCEIINIFVTRSCVLSNTQFRDLRSQNQIQIFQWKVTSFSKTTLIQREPFLTTFYTFITRYQVSFYADNFEKVHIVSSAF